MADTAIIPARGAWRLARTTLADGSHIDSFVYWSEELGRYVTVPDRDDFTEAELLALEGS